MEREIGDIWYDDDSDPHHPGWVMLTDTADVQPLMSDWPLPRDAPEDELKSAGRRTLHYHDGRGSECIRLA